MKITAIETHVCHARMRNWIFVKVLTDQAGLFGWGEATLEWHTRAVVGAIEDLAAAARRRRPDAHRASLADDVPPALLARQRHRPRHRDRRHRHRAVGHPRQGRTACRATSSGAARCATTSALYCHLGGGKMEDFYETSPTTPKRFARSRAAGGRATASPRSSRWPCRRRCRSRGCSRSARRSAASRRCARRSATAIDIMVDCHARPSPAMGLQFAKALEPYGLYFLEEPCWPESVEGLAAIKRAVSTPIATGERLSNLRGVSRPVREPGACSVCQLDITHCGGLTEARRIAALAEAHRIALAPHNPQGPVSTAASLEFGFSTAELHHLRNGARRRAVAAGRRAGRLHRRKKGRIVRPNTSPGWASRSTRRGEEASVPAGVAAARVLRRRQRGRLVAGRHAAGSSSDRSSVTPSPGRSESVTRPRSARGSSGNATQKIWSSSASSGAPAAACTRAAASRGSRSPGGLVRETEVRDDVEAERLAERPDAPRLGDAAEPVHVRLEHVDRAGVDELAEAVARRLVLARGDGRRDGGADAREPGDSSGIDGLLDPAQPDARILDRPDAPDRVADSQLMYASAITSTPGPTASTTVRTSSTFRAIPRVPRAARAGGAA